MTESDADRAAFARDGVVMLRGAVAGDWIERLRAAVAEAAPPGDTPAFHNIANLYRSQSVWREFVLDGPLPALVADVIGARRIVAYADVLLVKEAGAAARTPWHHDMPYWPFRAERACSAWTALDEVTAANGAMEYVAGSHRWDRWFKPAGATTQPIAESVEDMPDLDAQRDRHRLLRWNMMPGDVLVHHPLVVHGAGGNATGAARRAFSIRYVGEGSRYTGTALFGAPDVALTVGEPIETGDAFPIAWERATG